MSHALTTGDPMIARVVELLDAATVRDVARPTELVARYLEHQHGEDLDDIGAHNLAGIISAHVRLAERRSDDSDNVLADTPDPSDRWELPGSTLLQIVTDDRPFLVDSLTMEITRQDWTIRHTFHPQLTVARTGDGDLVHDGSGQSVAESWMTFVVYPPLGVAAEDVADRLVAGVRDVLMQVRLVTDDWTAMRQQLSDAVDLLGTSPYASRADDRDAARDLLRWLRDDNFTLLGYRSYAYDGIRYTVGGHAKVGFTLPGKPLTDLDMLAVVHGAASQTHQTGYNNIYHVFLPPGTDECLDAAFTTCYSPDKPSTSLRS